MTISGFYLLTLLTLLGYRTCNALTTSQPKIAFGANCNDISHCITANAVCNETCSCTNNMYHNATGETCTDKIAFGANCINALHCITGNAVCSETCSCTNNMYHNATGDTCTDKKGYGESCSGQIECGVPQGGNSQCVSVSGGNKCLCSEGWYWSGTQCQDINTLKPTLTLSNPGQRTVDAAWIANGTSYYTSSYTLTWKSSSGFPGQLHNTSGQSYTIPALAPGTTYTVSIWRTITEKRHGRIQNVPGNNQTETTRALAAFGEVCNASVRCDVTDTNVACTQTTEKGVNRCLCTAGTYRPSDSCVAIAPVLTPVLLDALSTETRRINVRWTNGDVTGSYSSLYMVAWISVPSGTTGAENTTLKYHFIQPLSPGTTYTVTVTHIITQYNRNQLIPSDARTYTTKQEYGGTCSTSVPCDDASNTISCNSLVSKCLCVDGTYRNGQACVQYSSLSPRFGTPTIGTRYVYVQWSDQPASNYNDVYQLTISFDGTVRTATGKFYNFTDLQQGTNYTVSLVRTITRYGRNQSLPAVTTTTRTKVGYNQTCQEASDTCIDANTRCQRSKCRCDVGFYWDSNCVSIDRLEPTTVTVSVDSTTTMTASWVSPDNVVVTGYEVIVMPDDIPRITVGKYTKTTPITGLTPGRQYNVSVKTKITYLQGRDEKTAALSAQPKVTTPDTVDGLGDKTNLTAPDIIIHFLKADGDVHYYLVQLQGITDGSYLQTTFVAPPATNTTFNGVVPNYQYNLTITTYNNQQQSIPYTSTIRVRASLAGTVNNFQKTSLTSRNVSVSWMRPVSTNGDLFEYRLEVFNGACRQQIVFNFTECIRNASVEGSGNCENTTVVPISASDINDASHVVIYTITGLLPDTNYVVKVAAYNQEGRGMDSSVAVLTNVEAAREPTAFTAKSKTSDSITLTWAPPEPRPGVTHYNISVYEKNEYTSVYDYNGTKGITGYNHNMYTVTHLSSAWEYKFYIQAFTLKGGSEKVPSDVVMTEESVPIEVNNFKLTRIPKVYNKLKLSWDCPKRKDGRNGIITSATLIYHTNETSVKYTKTYANTNACKWEEQVEVTPDFFYVFTVQIRNSFQGLPSIIWAYIPVGVPSLDKTILSVRSGGGSVGTNVIPLEICAACLHNAVNGNIVKSGLLVCKVGDCQIRNAIDDTRGDYYDKLPNWHSATGSGFTSMYRATSDGWMSGRERDDIVSYTVGGDTCEIADQSRFCNGPLLTDKSYRVWAFACTSVGCTETPYVEVALTAATGTTDVGTVVGAVVGVIVFAVIVLIIIVVYVKVIRKSGSKKNQDRINVEPTHKHDDTYEEIGDGQRMHVIRESNSNDGGYVNLASVHSPDGFDSTYEQLATYQNADIHDYGHINVTSSNTGTRSKR